MVTWINVYADGRFEQYHLVNPDPDNILLRCTRGITSERTCRRTKITTISIYSDCDIRFKNAD